MPVTPPQKITTRLSMPPAAENGSGTETKHPPKAWSSGRVLTEHQRKRKRETDRLRIRKRRQENEEKLRFLEEELKTLTRSIPQEDEIIKLAAHVKRLEAENRSLRERRLLTANTVQTTVAATSSDSIRPTSKTPAARSSYKNDKSLPIATLDEFLRTDSSVVTKINIQRLPTKTPVVDLKPQLAVIPTYHGPQPPPPPGTPFAQLSPISTVTAAEIALQPWMITESCNSILWSTRTLRPEDICSDDATNQHMLVLAMFEGWEAVESQLSFCPLWAILRDVGFVIFSGCSTIERLVMLRMIHLMLLVSDSLIYYHFFLLRFPFFILFHCHPSSLFPS